jgi:hypothetical protein
MAAAKAAWEWFEGNAAELIGFGGLLSEGILADLTHLGDRLTPSERCTLCFLAARSEAVPIPLLRQTLNISPTEGLALIESLQRRSLIAKVKFGSSTAIALPPVIRAWAAETLTRA